MDKLVPEGLLVRRWKERRWCVSPLVKKATGSERKACCRVLWISLRRVRSSTYSLPLSFAEIILSCVRKRGIWSLRRAAFPVILIRVAGRYSSTANARRVRLWTQRYHSLVQICELVLIVTASRSASFGWPKSIRLATSCTVPPRLLRNSLRLLGRDARSPVSFGTHSGRYRNQRPSQVE